MNALQEFNFSENTVRVILIGDDPWWLATDVCKILNIVNGPQAVSRLESDEISTICLTDSGNLNQNRTIINESGLYNLIIRSDKPEAKVFRKWITSEVLPQIRKTGNYSINVPKTLPEALRAYATEIEAKETALKRAQIAETALIELTPKAEKYNQFLDAKNLATLEIAAKSLGIGRNKLTTFLRDKKIFYRKYDNGENHVYQKYLDSGYFIVKIQSLQRGEIKTNYPQIFVTARGLSFIQDLFKKGENTISTSP